MKSRKGEVMMASDKWTAGQMRLLRAVAEFRTSNDSYEEWCTWCGALQVHGEPRRHEHDCVHLEAKRLLAELERKASPRAVPTMAKEREAAKKRVEAKRVTRKALAELEGDDG